MRGHVMSSGCGPSSMGCYSPSKDDIVSTIAHQLKTSFENAKTDPPLDQLSAGCQVNGHINNIWPDDLAERQAAQSLVLLGTSPEPPKHMPPTGDEDMAIDGLLHLHNLSPHQSDLCVKDNGCSSSTAEWDLGEIPDLGDVQLSQIIGCLEDDTLSDVDIAGRKSAGNDLIGPSLLESPTKAGQVLHNLMHAHPTAHKETVSQSLCHPPRCHPPRCQSLPSPADCHKAIMQLNTLRKAQSCATLSDNNTLKPVTPPTNKSTTNESLMTSLTVAGVTLPAVCSPQLGLDRSFVFISDVFEKFFSKRHWDEFKTILEKNNIESKVVPVVYGNCTENMQVISEDDLKILLLGNEARKEGFVRCTHLLTDEKGRLTKHDSLMLAPCERIPGELASGIRTRNSLQCDIGYVQVEGYTLPCISTKLNEQYVRLADVQTVCINENTLSNVTSSHVRVLKAACLRLGILVHKCSSNEKSRLVVVAHSTRSNSLHVIPASELPKLIIYLKSGGHQKRPHSPESSNNRKKLKFGSSRFTGSSSEAGDSWDCDSVSSAVSAQNSSDNKSSSFAGTKEAPGRSHEPLKLSIILRNEGDGKFKIEQPRCPSPPINNIQELMQQMRPLTVTLRKGVFVVVAVSNWSGTRGPMGRYWDNLFECKHATCIQCMVCHNFYSVQDFINHSIYHGLNVPQPRLFTLSSNTKLEYLRYPLWQSLQEKLIRFDLSELSYVLPVNLSQYYKQRSSNTLSGQITRKGVVSVLKKGIANGNHSERDTMKDVRRWLLDERMATLPLNVVHQSYIPPSSADPNLIALRKSLPPGKPRRPIQTTSLDLVWRRRLDESQELPNTWVIGDHSKEKDELISFWFDSVS